MKNQTQKTATPSAKARRKSETLTLGRDTALAFQRVLARDRAETSEFLPESPEKSAQMDRMFGPFYRRHLANQSLRLACEEILNKKGSIVSGCAWWKLELTQMSDEEFAAEKALADAASCATSR